MSYICGLCEGRGELQDVPTRRGATDVTCRLCDGEGEVSALRDAKLCECCEQGVEAFMQKAPTLAFCDACAAEDHEPCDPEDEIRTRDRWQRDGFSSRRQRFHG